MTPAISVFKFGTRRIYLRDGIISDELTRHQHSLMNRKNFLKILLASGFLMLALSFYASGRSYAARASYYLHENWPALTALVSRDEFEIKKTPTLLPLAANIEESLMGLATAGENYEVQSVPPALSSHASAPLGASETSPVEKKLIEAAAIPKTPRIRIPSLRVSAPIVETAFNLKTINKDLGGGVIRWPGSAEIGSGGTSVLLGHSSAPMTYRGKYGSVFALLDKLKAGDPIAIEMSGKILHYRVRDHFIIDPKNAKEDVLQSLDGEGIVLVSCWPVGTNWQRIAVRADRVE
ncbi:MAG: class E sortase [bacterium]|nr:class E sortase [bacterium]